ncbi:MAG TPA: HD domain-containing protein [Candidatus Paceibacterota bacterium]|nr:HD domain-containing protein [Candidatus Paceibacterota bacterium]
MLDGSLKNVILKIEKEKGMLERMGFLSAAENRGSFFKRIALLFPPLDPRYKAIERAYNCAKDAFRGVNREGGERYFEHIRAVVLILIDYLRVNDYRIIIAALLHDIVEDIPSWTIDRVRLEFGEFVARLVEYLTKPSKEEYSSKEERDLIYHSRFRFAPRNFFLIKLADRLHNILTLGVCTPEKQQRKITETRMHYLPFAEKHLIFYHELIEAIERFQTSA